MLLGNLLLLTTIMAICVKEESIWVEIDHVVVVPTARGDGEAGRARYPLPQLKKSGGRVTIGFQALTLENDWISALIVPGLGGRILSLKFRGEECLAVPRAEDGTFRLDLDDAMELHAGLEFTLYGRARKQAVAPLGVHIFEEDDEVGVTLGELDPGNPLSWQATIALRSDECVLQIEFKAQNRSLEPIPYSSGMRWTGTVGVVSDPGVFAVEDSQHVDRDGELLGGRLVDRWQALVFPCPQPVIAMSWIGALAEGMFYPTQTVPQAKVYVKRGADTLSATLDLVIAEPKAVPAGEVFLIRSAHGEPLTGWPVEHAPEELALRRQLLHPDRRPAAMIGLAFRAHADGDIEATSEFIEEAIGLNHEDALAWWFRAAIRRDEESEDLPNAHYLAPLEPLLRAESFLRMGTQGRDPNPLVALLADDPDVLIDVAFRLWEAGFAEDFSRWIDECLRHREVPMLRYILADRLLENSRMAAEAAQHVGQVAKAPINPPYPWRAEERAVLDRLAERFPEDARIAELREMMIEFAS